MNTQQQIEQLTTSLRNLVTAFESHLADEAKEKGKGIAVEELCPCTTDEIKASKDLLERLRE